MDQLTLKQFPFEAGFAQAPDPALPERLDFTLEIDPVSGVIVEKMNPEIQAALKHYYEVGGYGSTPLGESEFATRQGQEIVDELAGCLRAVGKRIEDSDFLEIGSSYGFLLHLLKGLGAKSVIGVEPGDEGNVGSKKYGIPLVQDFFPTDKLTGTFDVIFSHAVMEHIENPSVIISAMAKRLNPGGVVFLAVPECEKKLRVGDVSILSHQHVNYFTGQTLGGVLEAAGLRDVVVRSSPLRSILYAWGVLRADERSVSGTPVSDAPLLQAFSDAYEKNLAAMQAIIDEAEAQGQRIGLYGASIVLKGVLRFANEPRLFDSDIGKHGKRMAGMGSPIESPQALLTNPVDVLLICPIDYDREIRAALETMGLPKGTRMVSLKELFEANGGVHYDVGSK
ncbi:class I SAM-dependent methyltransferase [Patescibacteria group bacterium]|jgi:SAM-dependent methyltransferase|nr:class I SAM-dependent methyltransferase [Patescibacteria group bacterium]